MQFGLDIRGGSGRYLPLKNGRAICPQCGATLIAKCGTIVVHHWAHESVADCDPWWESETKWHLDWKGHVPPERREVTMKGHRADVVRLDGTVVELQASSISLEEIHERETAYGKKMMWLFNGITISDDHLLLRHKTSPTGNKYISFRWKHPRKTYGHADRNVFVDLWGGDYSILHLRKLYLDGPPYGGWGVLIKRDKFVSWLQR